MLTLGPPEADEQLRYALSVGTDGAVLVADRRRRPGPAGHGAGAGRGHRRRWRRRTGRSTSSCSATSPPTPAASRSGSARRGPSAARWSTASRASRSRAAPSPRAARAPTGSRCTGWPLPAVLGVKEGLNLPRYPTLPGRLRSKKADVARLDARGRGRRAADARLQPAHRAGHRHDRARHGRRCRSGGRRPPPGAGPAVTVLALVEHDRGVPAETAYQALAFARHIAEPDRLGRSRPCSSAPTPRGWPPLRPSTAPPRSGWSATRR